MIGISDGGSLVGLSLLPQNYSVTVRIVSGMKNQKCCEWGPRVRVKKVESFS